MFEGRHFSHGGGYKDWAIRFADCKVRVGVATTAYSYGMTDSERTEMARRITAALNFTKNIPTAQLEAAAPLN